MKRILFSILITAGLLALLLSQIPLEELVLSLKKIDMASLLTAFVLYLGLYAARAARFKFFIPKKTSFWHLFRISVAHNFITRAVPMKIGELSFVEFLRSRWGVPRSYGLGTLLIIRIFDLLTIVFLAASSLFAIRFGGTKTWTLIMLAAVILALAVSRMDYLFKKMFDLLLFAGRKFKISARNMERIKHIRDNISLPLALIKQPKNFASVFGLSLACWSFGFAVFYVLAIPAGLNVPLAMFIPGASLAFFANTLPISVIGDLGVHETGWTLGFMALGVDKETAIVTGLSVHLVVLAFMVLVFIMFGAHEIYDYLKRNIRDK